MKVRSIRKAVVLLAGLSTFALGCELIVDFDRTQIPPEFADTGVPDSALPDATADAVAADTGVDAQADAGADAADASDAADAADAADAGDADAS